MAGFGLWDRSKMEPVDARWVNVSANIEMRAADAGYLGPRPRTSATFENQNSCGPSIRLGMPPQPRILCDAGHRSHPLNQSIPETIEPRDQPKQKAEQQRQNDNQNNHPKPHSLLPFGFFAFIHAVCLARV